MKEAGVRITLINDQKPLSQEHQSNIPIDSNANPEPPRPTKLPPFDLTNGPREIYLEIGVPLYEASIKCDWKAAKDIIDAHPQRQLVRCSITENKETALHVAASAKGPKHVDEFVKNLVDLMEKDDLELQNKNHNTALCLAAAAGNINTVKIMAEKNKGLLMIAGSKKMMPLYIAALFGNVDVVKYLYNNSNRLGDNNGWCTETRDWLLEKCVENNMFDVALDIVKTYPQLDTGNVLRILARKPEAFRKTKLNIMWRIINWGNHIYSKMLVTQQPSQNEYPFPETNYNVITRAIKSVSEFFGLKPTGSKDNEIYAMQLLRIIWKDIAKKPSKEINTIIRGKQDEKQGENAIKDELQKLISEHVVKMHVEMQNVIARLPGNDDQILQLQKLVSEHLTKMNVETHNVIINRQKATTNDPNVAPSYKVKRTYSSWILFIAAEMGNTKFVVELIRLYPDLIWKVNDNNQTIFHIAIENRHESIYNLLYEIGSMKDLITPLKDDKDNNMLHLVGKSAKQKRLQDVSGVALQMQRELLWFKEVEAKIPPSYRELKNKDGLTPHELFTKEHKDLVTRGEKWMKETANQCMVVAALIATMVFAAAFTVPGGYDQKTGIPIFRSKGTFIVFVVADAISLFASSASILMFLSILTSRYAERDFLQSLPEKLMLGLATLFLSIVTMTVAFSAGFFLLYRKGFLWVPILLCVLAVSPVLLYMLLHFGLFSDVLRSTYRSGYLFKPKKHVLYYKNPNV